MFRDQAFTLTHLLLILFVRVIDPARETTSTDLSVNTFKHLGKTECLSLYVDVSICVCVFENA